MYKGSEKSPGMRSRPTTGEGDAGEGEADGEDDAFPGGPWAPPQLANASTAATSIATINQRSLMMTPFRMLRQRQTLTGLWPSGPLLVARAARLLRAGLAVGFPPRCGQANLSP